MVLLYMVTWIPSIYPSHPMGYKMKLPTGLCKVRQNPSSLCFCWWICRPWLVFGGSLAECRRLRVENKPLKYIEITYHGLKSIKNHHNVENPHPLKSYLRAIFLMHFSHGCGSKTLDTPRKGGYLFYIPIWNIPLKWYHVYIHFHPLHPWFLGVWKRTGKGIADVF